MESLDSREAVARARARPARRAGVRRRPERRASSCRPTCATRRRRSTRVLDWARSHARDAAARRAPRQGRLLGPRGRRGAPARLERPGLRAQGRLRPRTSRRSPRGCSRRGRSLRVAIASHNLRSVSHAVALQPRCSAADDRDVEFQVLRGLGDDLGHALPRHGLRVRAYCPVGDLVAGHGLPRAPPAREHGKRELPRRPGAAASRSRQLLAAPMSLAPRSPTSRCSSCAAPPSARSSPSALGELDPVLPLRVPVWIGERPPRGRGARLDRPGRARARRRARRARDARGGRRRGRRRARAPSRPGPRRPAAERAAALLRAAAWMRERRALARGAGGARVRASPGRRPTPTSARRSTSSSSTRAARSSSSRGPAAAAGARRAQRAALRAARRRAPSSRRGTSRSRSRRA